jgi:hypothetical protein
VLHRALPWLVVAAGCATGPRPRPFASPLLGAADVPPPVLGPPSRAAPAPLPPESRAVVRVASASAAAEVAEGVVWSRLPATGRIDEGAPWPALHDATDLRAYVGRRDPRAATPVVLGWARALGAEVPDGTPSELVEWADAHHRLGDPREAVGPGDLVVFDRTDSDEPSDLVGVAIARDDRGVLEFIYLAGRVVRRGFADLAHPSKRRDKRGAIENTFMRAGRRWPPKGTHYLAGELLAHLVRAR